MSLTKYINFLVRIFLIIIIFIIIKNEMKINFKYLNNNNNVYIITRKQKYNFKTVYNNEIFTHPYKNNNVITAFLNKNLANEKIKLLKIDKYNIEEISVKDLKYIKELFHMPLFIILNEYCEIYDKTNIQEVYYIK
jgi:hypothetical protein